MTTSKSASSISPKTSSTPTSRPPHHPKDRHVPDPRRANPFRRCRALLPGHWRLHSTKPRKHRPLAKIACLMHEAEIPFLAAATAKIPGFSSFGQSLRLRQVQPAHRPRPLRQTPHPQTRPLPRPHRPATSSSPALRPKPTPSTPTPSTRCPTLPSPNNTSGPMAPRRRVLIGQAFLDNGWDGIEPGNDVSDLPCHMAVVEGDKEMTPCARAGCPTASAMSSTS